MFERNTGNPGKKGKGNVLDLISKESKTASSKEVCIQIQCINLLSQPYCPCLHLLHGLCPVLLTFIFLLPCSVQVIFEHDANLSLVSQIFDEGVSQQDVSGRSMQMVLDQTAINKWQETLWPVEKKRETDEGLEQRKQTDNILGINRWQMTVNFLHFLNVSFINLGTEYKFDHLKPLYWQQSSLQSDILFKTLIKPKNNLLINNNVPQGAKRMT